MSTDSLTHAIGMSLNLLCKLSGKTIAISYFIQLREERAAMPQQDPDLQSTAPQKLDNYWQ